MFVRRKNKASPLPVVLYVLLLIKAQVRRGNLNTPLVRPRGYNPQWCIPNKRLAETR